MAHHQQQLQQAAVKSQQQQAAAASSTRSTSATEADEEAAPRRKKHKRGNELLEQRQLVKDLAVELVNDRVHFRSCYGICEFTGTQDLLNSLRYLMRKDQALVDVMKHRNRANVVFVERALSALDRLVPPRDGVQARESLALQREDIARTRDETADIFNFVELKRVASSLDWNSETRRTRDGSKIIALHNRSLPDENLKYRIFDFANHVTRYSKLSDGLRSEVLSNCATILFYDSGYKSVQGISRLDRLWRRRMEDSYRTGSETHPLRGLYKGSTKYADKFDAENEGGVLKYFRYAQKTIGNQSSYADLAACMNRKADVDGCSVQGKRATFNSTNVYRWFKRLGGKEKSPVEKPALTPEMKQERVKWCRKIKKLIKKSGGKFYACFLDKKWFYITSRRRKMKLLPAQPGESEDVVANEVPTTRSRRFPVKSMYLGVVANPIPSKKL